MQKNLIAMAIAVALVLFAGGSTAMADGFEGPIGPETYEIDLEDVLNDGLGGTIWATFSESVDRFEIVKASSSVVVAEDDDLMFDGIDQWAWNDAEYTGWEVGDYYVDAYDSCNNLLDRLIITINP